MRLLLETIKPENEGSCGGMTVSNSLRLYGCKSNVVYGRSQLFDGICLNSLIIFYNLILDTYFTLNLLLYDFLVLQDFHRWF